MSEVKKTRSELKREAILEAAKHAFKEFGVQGTSMDKLSSIAQVSKRTVYNHFPSKEALVMELLSELWRAAMQGKDIAHFDSLSLKQQLIELLKSEIEVLTDKDYVELARVAFGYYFYKPEELKQQMEKMDKKDTALFRWLADNHEQGSLNIEDLERANMQLHNLIKGDAFWPQLLGATDTLDSVQIESLASHTADFFLSHYAKQ